MGDDLLVTNPTCIEKELEVGACNALLMMTQIGSISKAIKAATMSQAAGWGVMVSHRSGETEDSSIADSVACLGTEHIKTSQRRSVEINHGHTSMDASIGRAFRNTRSSVAFCRVMGDSGLILTQLKDIS